MTVKRERIRYTTEKKQTVVARMMPPQNEAVAKIYEETGITEATLYKWRKEAVLLAVLHLVTDKQVINGAAKINFSGDGNIRDERSRTS